MPNKLKEKPISFLLNKKEIDYLRGKSEERGLPIVPLSLYTRGPHIKVELGIGRGKILIPRSI